MTQPKDAGLVDMFDDDANQSQVPPDSALAQVSDLAKRQISLEDEVEEIEAKLKERKAELRKVSEVEFPEAFTELNLSEFKLDTGEKITVDRKLKAGITKAREAAAFKWLRDNGAESLIKADLKMKFGKGKKEKELQSRVIDALNDLGITPNFKEAVAWNTLTAFVKERIENGEPVDTELLGVIELASTKIVRP